MQVETHTWVTLGFSVFLLVGALRVLADQRDKEKQSEDCEQDPK